MPYGVKRGVKTPGNFTISDMSGLALSGAAGIIAAIVTDYQQSGEASALFTINQWVVQLGGLLGFTDIPLWMVIVGMTLIGAGSIFYFQPITRQGAFAQGFGLLAVLMTAVPADLAGGIEGITETLDGFQPAAEVREATADAQLYRANIDAAAAPGTTLAQAEQEASKFDVRLTVNFPEGLPADLDTMIRRGSLRGRLHNENTNETWNLFRTAGGSVTRSDNALIIRAGVPARAQSARLWVRVEAQGYAIQVESYQASLDTPVEWSIDMIPSSTPLFLQRLGKSYWF